MLQRFSPNIFYSRLLLSAFFIFCSIPFFLPQPAEAKILNLMLNPVRLIFNGRDRAATLSVVNNNNQPAEYRVSILPLRKGKDGRWVTPQTITPQDEKIAKLIRFSPRRARIKGNAKQVIKFMLRKPADLPKGEYRAKVVLTPVVKQNTAGKQIVDAPFSPGLDVQVISHFPIIIQHNEELPSVVPLDISLVDYPNSPAGKAVKVHYQRKGAVSSFGNVELLYRAAANDEWRQIGRTKGLAIYSPETQKDSTIILENISPEELQKGVLRLEYRHNNGRQKRSKKPDSVREFRL